MIGRAEYREAIAHWIEMVENTITWPGPDAQERAPFKHAPYRESLDDPDSVPPGGANRRFRIMITSITPGGPSKPTFGGRIEDRTLAATLMMVYFTGGSGDYDEEETRILAAQDGEALMQRFRNQRNKLTHDDEDVHTGMASVTTGTASIDSMEDRVILTLPIEAQMRVRLEPYQGAAA